MDVRAGGKGSAWKRCIVGAVVCGALVFAAGFLHRNAVASAVDAQQTKAAAYVHGRLTDAVGHTALSKPLGTRDAASLEKDAVVPAGTAVRIFSLDGTLVFATDGARGAAGDRAAIASAARGDVNHAIAGNDFVVYAPIEGKGAKPVAVAAVVSDQVALLDDATGPLDGLRLPLVGIGVLLLIAGLVLMVRGGSSTTKTSGAAGSRSQDTQQGKQAAEASKGRVSGFAPAPALVPSTASAPPSEGSASRRSGLFGKRASKQESVPPPAPSEPKAKRGLFGRGESKAAEEPVTPQPNRSATADAAREIAIREALEDQLEQLRTRIQLQDEATRELQAQLESAASRAEAAESRARLEPGATPTVGPAERDLIERVRGLEADLAQAKAAAAGAMARADELQRAADASPANATAPNTEALAAELVAVREQLALAQQGAEEAQRLAAEAEQRAASIESVRGELEVRVAQMGAKAGELEQKATELETRLRDANAGGDAVRAEIASLTAALAASQSLVTELESSTPAGSSANELEASAAEVARLRTELANHMERAQSAEDRVATLEADVLAAEHGVNEMPPEGSDENIDREDFRGAVAPSERVDEPRDVAPASTVMWSASEPVSEPAEPAPAAAPERAWETEEPERASATVARTVWVAPLQHDATTQSEPAQESESAPDLPEDSTDAQAAPVESAGTPIETSAWVDVPEKPETASVPLMPPDGRYGDVWAVPFTEPDPKPDAEAAEAPDESGETTTTPAAQADPTVTSSLDEPSPQEESVSVEDDLWALRARLAHGNGKPEEDRESERQDSTSDSPRWS